MFIEASVTPATASRRARLRSDGWIPPQSFSRHLAPHAHAGPPRLVCLSARATEQDQAIMTEALPVVYLARHGETAWSVSGQHTGLTDLPLTERGECNARQLRERMSGLTFAHLFN